VYVRTGLPATVANSLSKPIRRLSPAATMIAESTVKRAKKLKKLQGWSRQSEFPF
jgi:hypothetical protein